MRPNTVPQRLPPPPGARPESTAKQPQTTRFRTQDFEKFINRLPKEKQNQARELFPKDFTGHWMKIEEKSFNEFVTLLDPHEQRSFKRSLPVLITCSRLNPEPAPGARRPAKGEDLHAPIGSQRHHPSGRDGGPSLGDLLAAEKAGKESHVPPQARTQGQPNRVGLAETASVRLFPIGKVFKPGDFHVGWPHEVDSSPKGKPKPFVPTPDFPTLQGISLSDATVPKLGRQGQEAPYPLHIESYPPPSPTKGILKKPALGEKNTQEPVQGQEKSQESTRSKESTSESAQGQENSPRKMSKTQKFVLGAAATVATLTTLSILADTPSSDAPEKT